MSPHRRGNDQPLKVDLTRCCPEAQCDGVPCPTLGRSCEICERAIDSASGPERMPTIRPAGND